MALLGAQFVNAVSPNPVGSLQAYAGASAPTGWLLCDGTSYTTAAYPELYSVLGYTYGGSGANFNVPDLRGRVPMGAGTGAGLNASGTGAPSGTAQTARTRGQWGGEETHLLTGAESGTSAHGHNMYGTQGNYGTENGFPFTGRVVFSRSGGPNEGAGYNFPSGNLYASTTAEANAASRHNNVPPFLVTNYIIKALPDAPRSGLAYGSTPPIVTALPANPQFGDVVTYVADATNGVYWDLQYDATGTYPWKFIGGSPLTASAVGTFSSPATGSTSTYVNSGLSGSPTITAPLAGDYITCVNANGKTSNSSPAPGVFISYASAVPGSWDGSDSLAGGGAATSYVLGAQKRGTVTAASQAIALVWTNANIGGTVSFYSIYMSATPIRVKAA